MEFRTVILSIYCWSKNLAKIKFCTEELSIGHTTAVDWKNFLREICAWRLLQTPTIVGGPGLHVEINETLISCRKNHAGRVLPSSGFSEGSAGRLKKSSCMQCKIELWPLCWTQSRPASLPAQSPFPVCGHHTKELKR